MKREAKFVIIFWFLLQSIGYNSAYGLDYEFDFGGDPLSVKIDSSVNYSAAWRVQSPDRAKRNPPRGDLQLIEIGSLKIPGSALPYMQNSLSVFLKEPVINLDDHVDLLNIVGGMDNGGDRFLTQATWGALIVNGNDGSRNYDTGLIGNRVGFLSELSVTWRELGMYIKARGWYDVYLKDHNPEVYEVSSSQLYLGTEWPAGDYNGSTLGRWESDAEENGSGAEFLDAFVYGNFPIGERILTTRLGRQVINWGESLAFQNGISSAQNSLDAEAGLRPGTVLKEIFRPTGALFSQIDITADITLETYLQYEHQGIVLPPAGTYWSETDFMGDGGDWFYIPVVGSLKRIREEKEVSDDGQWGLATRYITPGGMEIGVYHLRYHDKILSYTPHLKQRTYSTYYVEDIRLYGLSFGTVYGVTNVSGEISYRPNTTVILDSVPNQLHGFGETSRGEYIQAQLSWIHIFTPTRFWDSYTCVGEIVGWKFGAVNGGGHRDADLNNTNSATGWGALIMNMIEYKNIIRGFDLMVPINIQYGFDGNNMRVNSRQHALITSLGLSLSYMSNFEVSLIYTQYDGPHSSSSPTPDYYNFVDRDNIGLSIKYNF